MAKGRKVENSKLYCRSKLLSWERCQRGTVYPWTVIPQGSCVCHMCLYIATKRLLPPCHTNQSSCCTFRWLLCPQGPFRSNRFSFSESHNPHPYPVFCNTSISLPYTLLFDWTRGSTGLGWFQTWVLTAMLADRTGKMRTALKLCLLSHN